MIKKIFILIILFSFFSCEVPALKYYPKWVKIATEIEHKIKGNNKILFKTEDLDITAFAESRFNYITIAVIVKNFSHGEYTIDLTKCYITDKNENKTKIFKQYYGDKIILNYNEKKVLYLPFNPDIFIEKFNFTFFCIKDKKNNDELKFDIYFEADHNEFVNYVEKYARQEIKEKMFKE